MNNGCLCCTVRGRPDADSHAPPQAQGPPSTASSSKPPAWPTPALSRRRSSATPKSARHTGWTELSRWSTPAISRNISTMERRPGSRWPSPTSSCSTRLIWPRPPTSDRLEARLHHMNTAARNLPDARLRNRHQPRCLDIGGFNLSRAAGLDPAFLDPNIRSNGPACYETRAAPTSSASARPPSPRKRSGHDHDRAHEEAQ